MIDHPTTADAWTAHLIPWVSSADADAPRPIGAVDDRPTIAVSHPISTNTDHTGLRASLDQFRLPRTRPTSAAA